MLKLKRIGAVNVLAALGLVTACEQAGLNHADKFDPDVERQEQTQLLHNQTAAVIKAYLLFSGLRRVIVINVPWYLRE